MDTTTAKEGAIDNMRASRTDPHGSHTHLQQVAAVNWSTGEGG
jgi:hypothetical protein